MQESNMTEWDWGVHLSQWERSFNNGIPPTMKPVCKSKETVFNIEPDHTPVEPRQGQQSLPIIRIERRSAKAKFFVTEDSMSGVFGFWCPKGIIDRESSTNVDVPEWFEMKIVEFL
tara:strand:+ start:707 stop:1054 length:348 start_codon:yes stop_codon:yes gene_type:complete